MEAPTASEAADRIRPVLGGRDDVAFSYLFGSEAKGTARPDSDLDVAVHFEGSGRTAFGRRRAEDPSTPSSRARQALELEGSLEETLGRRVQVVVLNDAPLDLAHTVLKTGILLTCDDDRARREFYVDHARRFFDMARARRIFDRYRTRRIEQGSFGGRARDGS